ncbi:MAG: hypothetical protein V8T86_07070 [Victivallis sp.]
MDAEAAQPSWKELQEPDPEPLTEYNELEKTLNDAHRALQGKYQTVQPDHQKIRISNWAMRFFRFQPRERFSTGISCCTPANVKDGKSRLPMFAGITLLL